MTLASVWIQRLNIFFVLQLACELFTKTVLTFTSLRQLVNFGAINFVPFLDSSQFIKSFTSHLASCLLLLFSVCLLVGSQATSYSDP